MTPAPALAALTATGHVFVAGITLASLAVVIRLVRRHQLGSKYSLLWITVAIIMAVFASFPGLLDRTSTAVGIDYPPAAFLAVAVAFLLVIVVQFSWELSRLTERTRTLAEEVALLRRTGPAAPGPGASEQPADR